MIQTETDPEGNQISYGYDNLGRLGSVRNARDYSPGTARFVQPDPLQHDAAGTHGYNPYWYANDPATFAGPSSVTG